MNYSLIRILFALVIGLVLVLWPNAAASYIVITVGVAFLIPGVISLFGYFGRKRPENAPAPRFPIEGVGSLLFGLWLIVMPEFFADVLMFLLGFILIMGGVQQIASLSMARRWMPVSGAFYLIPSLILIAGIVALFNPTGARALVNSPAVLLADEPSGNLDTRNKEEVHRLFFDLRERLGQTIVLVTHDESLALRADRRIVMSDGLILPE